MAAGENRATVLAVECKDTKFRGVELHGTARDGIEFTVEMPKTGSTVLNVGRGGANVLLISSPSIRRLLRKDLPYADNPLNQDMRNVRPVSMRGPPDRVFASALQQKIEIAEQLLRDPQLRRKAIPGIKMDLAELQRIQEMFPFTPL